MGKVKNLIWDEIEHDTEEPITAIPTPEEMQAAEKAVQIAQAEYDAADAAGLDTTEPLIELRSAIEACLDAQWRKDQAILMEAGVCSIST